MRQERSKTTVSDAKMLEDCEEARNIPKERGGPGFNEWERGFISSLRAQLERGGTIHSKQRSVLHELYGRI